MANEKKPQQGPSYEMTPKYSREDAGPDPDAIAERFFGKGSVKETQDGRRVLAPNPPDGWPNQR